MKPMSRPSKQQSFASLGFLQEKGVTRRKKFLGEIGAGGAMGAP